MDLFTNRKYVLLSLVLVIIEVLFFVSIYSPIECTTSVDGLINCYDLTAYLGWFGFVVGIIWAIFTLVMVYKEFFEKKEVKVVKSKKKAKKGKK